MPPDPPGPTDRNVGKNRPHRADPAVRALGFGGMLAIHPAQVDPINAAFTPGAKELAHARAVVQAFADHPGAGVVELEGAMLDRPPPVLTQRLLAEADAQ